MLFRATAETLRTIAADPKHLGAEIGFIAILHTWGQNLLHHPHVHCVVPGGGLSPDGSTLDRLPAGLLPARAGAVAPVPPAVPGDVAAGLRGGLTQVLQRPGRAAKTPARSPGISRRRPRPSGWSTPSRRSAGRERVLEYLGRYTHRVAIANSRLVEFADGQVAFRWKDYRHASRQKVMRLEAEEFTRRFLLHVLPSGFQRIRHYGWLANRSRAAKLERCRQLLDVPAPAPVPADEPADYRDRYQRLTGVSLWECPHCRRGRMLCIETLQPGALPRGPPDDAS